MNITSAIRGSYLEPSGADTLPGTLRRDLVRDATPKDVGDRDEPAGLESGLGRLAPQGNEGGLSKPQSHGYEVVADVVGHVCTRPCSSVRRLYPADELLGHVRGGDSQVRRLPGVSERARVAPRGLTPSGERHARR